MSSVLLHAAPSAPSDTRDAARPHLGDRRDARSELQIRAGAVQHLDAAFGEQLLLGVGRPRRSAPRRAARVARPSDARYAMLSSPVCGAHDRDFVALLGRVRVHEQALRPPTAPPWLRADRACTRSRSAARAPRAAGRRPRRASAGAARGSRRGRLRVPDTGAPGAVAAHVHQALADDRAQSGRHQRLEHRVGVVHGLHRQHASSCRRAAAPRPRAAPRRASVARVVRGLERPDARRAARRAAAGRRRARETASGTDGCASGRSRAARSPPSASIIVSPRASGGHAADRRDATAVDPDVARDDVAWRRSSSGWSRCE